MLEIKGKHAIAKVFTDLVESEALNQVRDICNLPFVDGCKVRIMPDAHPGAGCVIGTTLEIKDTVIPNLVGVDIGCGMYVVKLKEKRLELPKFDSVVKKSIPNGTDVRDKEHRFVEQIDIDNLVCKNSVYLSKVRLGLGTLGGGNHFIEVAKNEQGDIYIIIHSGSRYLGVQVADHYQLEAYKDINKRNYNKKVDELTEQYKQSGKTKEIGLALEALKKATPDVVSKTMAYCTGQLFDNYIHDMKIVQKYAELNRKAIMYDIIKSMKLHVEEEFTTVHNYIDADNMILRKGAVSAQAGEKLIIPINNEDGSLLCIGKGNADWNYSAPHGAGRLMSRSKAKSSFLVSDYKKSMKAAGVYSTTVCAGTLDECAKAYKPIESILDNIGDTVDVVERLLPIYNFKAGGEE